ncbi:hypothetical protein [Dyadobacter arcticus]|uniref:Uncharacterized protein n=1 Tax=Dyadobacter arcticus TaxID=1078754 RepID=A0ABX0UPB9_9BACT|nr:hypothetical protein [Dyadobacter arcticus]NIJ53530.1 hypothetical protein [Dyadobacter arcticus]
MPQYRGTEGDLISVKEAKLFTARHQEQREAIEREGANNYVEAEFFGLETFKQLLDECGGEPVGFRVYYGLRNEIHSDGEPEVDEKGKPTPRLIIVPVDSHGVDLTGLVSVGGGLKDMAAEAKAMGNGPVCPHICGR